VQLGDELTTLATESARTVVLAAAGDFWPLLKDRVRGLWQRFRPERQAEVEVEIESGTTGTTAGVALPAELESRLVEAWTARWSDLLSAEPEAVVAVREFLAEAGALGIAGGSGGMTQINSNSGSGEMFNVQGGNLIYHRAPPTSTSGSAADEAQ
jgi:hypothetical protein